MKISLVTDEVSADLETAIELGLEWGVHDFELRGIGSQRVPFYSDYQKQRVHELLDEYGVHVAAISPGLFKIPFPPINRQRFPLPVIDSHYYDRWRDAHRLLDAHLQELLPASIEYAKQVGTEQIIAFSFDRGNSPPGLPPDEILEIFQLASRQVAQAGLQLSIEVEDHFWADSGSRTAEIIRAVGEPGLGVNWDPANVIAAEDIPFPNGYRAVQNYVRHVHFKDVIHSADGACHYAIDGEIGWNEQIQSLAKNGYQGYISVEPHMQPKVASARAMVARLKKLIQMNEKANQLA